MKKHKEGMLRGVTLLLAMLLILMQLSGCAGREAEQEESSAVITEDSSESVTEETEEETKIPDYGGTMTVTMELQDVYNPLVVTDEQAVQILELIYEPFLEYDSEGRPQPAVASSWTLSEDKKEAVFTIDTSIKWQNGDPVTADDVAFTINTLMDEKDSIYYTCVSGIEAATARDEETLVVDFSKASAFNLYRLYFPVLSKDYYSSGLDKDPMGCGPYMFESYTSMQEIHLKANPDYYKGEPYISEVVVELTRSSKAQQSFDQKLSGLYHQDDINWGDYLNRNAVTVNTYTTSEAMVVEYNLERIPKVSERQAVAYAIDSAEILHDVYLDRGETTEIPFPPSAWYSPTDPARYGANSEKVLELLDVDDPLEVTLLVNSSDALQKEIGEALAEQLEAQGIGVTLKAVKQSEYKQLKSEGSYDLALNRVDLERDTQLRALIHNIPGYDQTDFDELYASLKDSASEQEMHQIYASIAQLVEEDLPVYTLFFLKQASLSGNGVYGELDPGMHHVFRGVEDLFIEYHLESEEVD